MRRALRSAAAGTQHHNSAGTKHQSATHSHRHRTKTSTGKAALLGTSATRRSRHTRLTQRATTSTATGDTTRVHAASRTIS